MEDQLEWERSLKSATGKDQDDSNLQALRDSLKQLQSKVSLISVGLVSDIMQFSPFI
jgi:hypothetical protein